MYHDQQNEEDSVRSPGESYAKFECNSNVMREFFKVPKDKQMTPASFQISIDPIDNQLRVTVDGAYGYYTSSISLASKFFISISAELQDTKSFKCSSMSITPVLKSLNSTQTCKFKFKTNGSLVVQQTISPENAPNTVVTIMFTVYPIVEPRTLSL